MYHSMAVCTKNQGPTTSSLFQDEAELGAGGDEAVGLGTCGSAAAQAQRAADYVLGKVPLPV